MLSKVKVKFLEIISCALNEKTPDISGFSEWGELMRLISAHNCWNFAFYAFEKTTVPGKVNEAVYAHFLSAVGQQMKQEHYQELIFDKFEAEKIDYLPMKGSIFRELYPHKEMRVSCDVDMLFEENSIERVRKVLSETGFEMKSDAKGGNHDLWQLDEITIEPHIAIMRGTNYCQYFSDIWQKTYAVAEGGCRRRLSDEDTYLTHIAHMGKHFIAGGCGVKAVSDVYLYRKKFPNLDDEYLDGELKKLGLYKFSKKMEKLSRCWFNDEVFDDDTEALTDYILDGGVYGTAKQSSVLKVGVNSENVKQAKRKYFLRRAFPPVKELKIGYPVLEKAPVLLPFIWVIRWFTALFTRFGNVKSNFRTFKGMTAEDVAKAKKIAKIVED